MAQKVPGPPRRYRLPQKDSPLKIYYFKILQPHPNFKGLHTLYVVTAYIVQS